jgi:hypothetical protein
MVQSSFAESRTSAKSVISLVLGILEILIWVIPYACFPIAIIGITLGALGLKTVKRGMAIAGLVLSSTAIIGTSLVTIMIVTGFLPSLIKF